MDKLQEKANELIAAANALGVDAKIAWASGLSVCVDYPGGIWSQVSFTDTGKISVRHYGREGAKKVTISSKNLPEWLLFELNRDNWRKAALAVR